MHRPLAAPSHPAAQSPGIYPAKKYVYDLHKKDWVETHTNIRIADTRRNFESGGMRVCFEVEELEEDGSGTPCVAKFFKKDIPDVVDVDYFNEAAAQCLSEEFAQNFNKTKGVPPGVRISFLASHVIRIEKKHLPSGPTPRNSFFDFKTKDTNDVVFGMEFKFTGEFTKFNNNFGETYEVANTKQNQKLTPKERSERQKLFQAAEAFSHFTLQETGGTMLVCDLQGVNDFFTDPQIHTEDGKGLGMGNMAQEGIDKWSENHKCNDICRAIGLKPFGRRAGIGGPPQGAPLTPPPPHPIQQNVQPYHPQQQQPQPYHLPQQQAQPYFQQQQPYAPPLQSPPQQFQSPNQQQQQAAKVLMTQPAVQQQQVFPPQQQQQQMPAPPSYLQSQSHPTLLPSPQPTPYYVGLPKEMIASAARRGINVQVPTRPFQKVAPPPPLHDYPRVQQQQQTAPPAANPGAPSPPKPLHAMTEEEQIQFALQISMNDQRR